MEDIIGNITSLVLLLNTELQKKESCFSVHQLEKMISTFSLMRDNILSKSSSTDLGSDLDMIMHWSVDSWPWDNLITKKTWHVIEEYNKNKNNYPIKHPKP